MKKNSPPKRMLNVKSKSANQFESKRMHKFSVQFQFSWQYQMQLLNLNLKKNRLRNERGPFKRRKSRSIDVINLRTLVEMVFDGHPFDQM